MRTYDLTPLFRTSVGFDRTHRLLNLAQELESTTKGYPPYNIVRTDETHYRITLAVAGFREDELELQTHEGRLTVTGRSAEDDDSVEYLHRGIAGRQFERVFQLADHIQVGNATLEHGLLHIELERIVPEALRPRTIAINKHQLTAE